MLAVAAAPAATSAVAAAVEMAATENFLAGNPLHYLLNGQWQKMDIFCHLIV